jgi:hypothetical protein
MARCRPTASITASVIVDFKLGQVLHEVRAAFLRKVMSQQGFTELIGYTVGVGDSRCRSAHLKHHASRQQASVKRLVRGNALGGDDVGEQSLLLPFDFTEVLFENRVFSVKIVA